MFQISSCVTGADECREGKGPLASPVPLMVQTAAAATGPPEREEKTRLCPLIDGQPNTMMDAYMQGSSPSRCWLMSRYYFFIRE
jgi:hypothetical protein